MSVSDSENSDTVRIYRVVVVGHDVRALRRLGSILRSHGFHPILYVDLEAAFNWLEEGGQCDVVLIRWEAEDDSAPEFAKRIRALTGELPVMLVTNFEDGGEDSRTVDHDRKEARGEDSQLAVLLKRLRSLLDAAVGDGRGMPEQITAGEMSLSPRSRKAYWRGDHVALTELEYRIVEKLVVKTDSGFLYREILDVVQEAAAGMDVMSGSLASLRLVLEQIQTKFCDCDDTFNMVEHDPNRGYRWRRTEPSTGIQARYESLTARENEVMQMVVQGLANKETALRLKISQRTVEHHRARIMQKMGTKSLADLVRLCLSAGIDDTRRGGE